MYISRPVLVVAFVGYCIVDDNGDNSIKLRSEGFDVGCAEHSRKNRMSMLRVSVQFLFKETRECVSPSCDRFIMRLWNTWSERSSCKIHLSYSVRNSQNCNIYRHKSMCVANFERNTNIHQGSLIKRHAGKYSYYSQNYRPRKLR